MIIIGAKGFAKQVIEIFNQRNDTNNLIFFDDVSENVGEAFYTFPIIRNLKDIKDLMLIDPRFCLAIGSPAARENLYQVFKTEGGVPTTIISPHSYIATYVKGIGDACTILTGAIIENDALIGNGVLVNSAASVHHDAVIGDFSEISPGARLLGNTSIGCNCSIGANAVILPKVTLGNNVVVGAGAVVTKDVPDNTTVVGIPAKALTK